MARATTIILLDSQPPHYTHGIRLLGVVTLVSYKVQRVSANKMSADGVINPSDILYCPSVPYLR